MSRRRLRWEGWRWLAPCLWARACAWLSSCVSLTSARSTQPAAAPSKTRRIARCSLSGRQAAAMPCLPVEPQGKAFRLTGFSGPRRAGWLHQSVIRLGPLDEGQQVARLRHAQRVPAVLHRPATLAVVPARLRRWALGLTWLASGPRAANSSNHSILIAPDFQICYYLQHCLHLASRSVVIHIILCTTGPGPARSRLGAAGLLGYVRGC